MGGRNERCVFEAYGSTSDIASDSFTTMMKRKYSCSGKVDSNGRYYTLITGKRKVDGHLRVQEVTNSKKEVLYYRAYVQFGE